MREPPIATVSSLTNFPKVAGADWWTPRATFRKCWSNFLSSAHPAHEVARQEFQADRRPSGLRLGPGSTLRLSDRPARPGPSVGQSASPAALARPDRPGDLRGFFLGITGYYRVLRRYYRVQLKGGLSDQDQRFRGSATRHNHASGDPTRAMERLAGPVQGRIVLVEDPGQCTGKRLGAPVQGRTCECRSRAGHKERLAAPVQGTTCECRSRGRPGFTSRRARRNAHF